MALRLLKAALFGRLTAVSSPPFLALRATRADVGSNAANTFIGARRAETVISRRTALQHHFAQSITWREIPLKSDGSPLGDRAVGKLLIRPDYVAPVENRARRQSTAVRRVRNLRWSTESNAPFAARTLDTSLLCAPDHVADRPHLTIATADRFARLGGTFSLQPMKGSRASRAKVGMTQGIGLEFGAEPRLLADVTSGEIKKDRVDALTR